MFNKKLPALFEKITSLPNGQKMSDENLKHCIPAGIAIIVQQHITPMIAHKIDKISPPKINHKMFPNTLIIFYLY